MLCMETNQAPRIVLKERGAKLEASLRGPVPIRFDLINFFAMFCMETNQAPRIVLKERGAKLEAFLRGMEI